MNKIFPIIFYIFIASIVPSQLLALGTGFYTTGRAGISDEGNGLAINYCLGAGFVLDTAVSTNELFNYRVNIGWENRIESGDSFFKKRDFNRFSISNNFGLGIIRNKYIRLWIGPQLDIGCQYKKNIENILNPAPPMVIIYEVHSINSAMFFFGFGAVLGLNINPGDLFTLGFEIGVSTVLGLGKNRDTKRGFMIIDDTFSSTAVIPQITSRDDADKAFGRIESFTRLSFIFRIAEAFPEARFQ